MSIVAAVMVPHPPVILPEIGRGEEQKISATTAAYRQAMKFLAEQKPDTVVVTSPHSVMYSDLFHIYPGAGARGSFAQFGAPEVRFNVGYDVDLVDELCGLAAEEKVFAGTIGDDPPELDHGVMVPLYFLREASGGGLPYQFVRIGLSGLPLIEHYRLGMLIRDAAENLGKRVAVIASGDLSHKLLPEGPYGFDEDGPVYDEKIMETMGSAAFGELVDYDAKFCSRAAECGHRSFTAMAGCFDGVSVKAERLSHEGPFGVGYGVCTYLPEGPDESRRFLLAYRDRQMAELEKKHEHEDDYVRLARRSFTSWVLKHQVTAFPDDLPTEMKEKAAGVFVSLHKEGQLRGCIGTIAPTRSSIAEEIVYNAISACSRDPRFMPVIPAELPYLECTVDVLSEPEKIDSAAELDPKRYGVIVSAFGKRGLLLPNLDGVDTVEQQVKIALKKAGLPETTVPEFERFEVVRHE
ncbi:MAG TPA: AmmeMemoRadiSam system protein A [Oscillospiraceae bacterium]|nr:AmmeMemoRadiSam system protein A [Oscillospiraceae bacterium]HRW56770.1 AmmeMemoRadiSam system protein A [Oscillospiraceae bacterium]